MKKFRIRIRPLLKYALLTACMALMNFALPRREPVSIALLYAALVCGYNPFLTAGGYLLASAASLSLMASVSAAVQAAFLLLVVCVYRKLDRKLKLERLLYAILAQLPFLFLFPHEGYAFPLSPMLQKLVLAGAFLLLCVLFEGGMSAINTRVFRSRLPASELTELALMWLFLGMGIANLLGAIPFYAVTLCALFAAVVLSETSASVPFAIVLSLPLCLVARSAVPLAEYAALASVALLFLPYGRLCSALSLSFTFAAASYFDGLYARGVAEIVLTLLACVLPAALVSLIPESRVRRARQVLLFYRETALPRVAVNRNRKAVGEQLYEVSSLFREIETAFDFAEPPMEEGAKLCEKLISSLCTGCVNRRSCNEAHIYDSFEKLIAVGKAKGRVNLIDLPADISARCNNSAGLLFALNKQLADYRKLTRDLEVAREGRKLLAQQAHGVSEILRNLALEQSEEYTFSEEEHRLSSALAREGLLSSEIFLYGEGENFTVTLTLESDTPAKKLIRIASEALRTPLTLSEKLPLTVDRSCFVLKRKPGFDAAFGIAARVKDGELASGDTHSILKIDERRFMVALSDGMGSGEHARTVSDRTLSLLESFYKAKMPSETVLGTVNNLIAFSADETFSCLDLASVNLDTGVADVVKIGSPPGFVLSGDTLQVLEGDSLPYGVLEAVHPATLRVEMAENDFLIFMSDGVTAAFGSNAELCNYLSRLHPINPQSLAEEILKAAISRYSGKAEDDMTVLTCKLTKSA